jgi:hypothetical protein
MISRLLQMLYHGLRTPPMCVIWIISIHSVRGRFSNGTKFNGSKLIPISVT